MQLKLPKPKAQQARGSMKFDNIKVRDKLIAALSKAAGHKVRAKTLYNGCLVFILHVEPADKMWPYNATGRKVFDLLPNLIRDYLKQSKLNASLRETETGALHVEIIKPERDGSCDCDVLAN
jgi:hypothetical protein